MARPSNCRISSLEAVALHSKDSKRSSSCLAVIASSSRERSLASNRLSATAAVKLFSADRGSALRRRSSSFPAASAAAARAEPDKFSQSAPSLLDPADASARTTCSFQDSSKTTLASCCLVFTRTVSFTFCCSDMNFRSSAAMAATRNSMSGSALRLLLEFTVLTSPPEPSSGAGSCIGLTVACTDAELVLIRVAATPAAGGLAIAASWVITCTVGSRTKYCCCWSLLAARPSTCDVIAPDCMLPSMDI
mmetsp:Transcript_18192/g.42315  ORF Transcript_18192/g.42315 Transcript_18192/m.42315 type:complete len:249 (-) Transcript_18192:402-1148(-)